MSGQRDGARTKIRKTEWCEIRMGGSLNGHSSGALATYALIGYCVATAVSATWVSFSFGGISGTAITFVTFLLAQVVYLVKARRDLQAVSMFVRREWKAVVVLNILTLSSWLFMFMALQRTEASVESAVYQGTVAIVGFMLAMVLARERFRGVTYAGLILAVLCLALLVLARLDESRVAPLRDHQVGIGSRSRSSPERLVDVTSIIHRQSTGGPRLPRPSSCAPGLFCCSS